MLLATVGYVSIGCLIYDFSHPEYDAEAAGTRTVYGCEFEGIRYSTLVQTWRFTTYEPGFVSRCFFGDHAAYRVYTRVEPWFRPVAAIARRCQGHAYRAESHVDQADDPNVVFCGRAYRWKVLEP